ncbi:MAG: hypothetical protein QXO47_08260 [Thermoproteota archaeon]
MSCSTAFKGDAERIVEVLRETDLPIEPLCYTESEFKKWLKKEPVNRGGA